MFEPDNSAKSVLLTAFNKNCGNLRSGERPFGLTLFGKGKLDPFKDEINPLSP
jgi:hypothetical protein